MIKYGRKLPKDILTKAIERLPAVFEKKPEIVAAYLRKTARPGAIFR
ncbi:hypothetical protein AN618_04240 [Fervidicola ferrireducens]|uniref:Uncharacterized protein n=1 Tax=Fervidicola ferrireducens TaxID=520764 RepID=A0A140LCT3_9FIRM|nr:hypothetical protein [Fervidicola ferrireducens]KXG78358.1 hypothetical protein AN618_04240 [Fervidicola ferrireducens]